VGLEPVEARLPRDLEGVSGLVIPGGESTTMSKLIEAYDLAGPIVELHRSGAAIFGTCAGMIAVASTAVDGRPDQRFLNLIDIDVRRNAFGRQVASFEAEVELEGDPTPFPGVFIRAPWIERAGSEVEVLASIGEHPIAARQGRVLVTAFHPELTSDRRLHQAFAVMVQEASQVAAA
jgi:pyridoxal 5'-phosphate synthase pdxT subunit